MAAYRDLVATLPELSIKGAANLYTSHNGNMFTMLTKEGEIGLRLGEEDRERFMAEYDVGPLYSYGGRMRGYVAVPAELIPRITELAPYLALSWEYVQTLPSKPTKRTA